MIVYRCKGEGVGSCKRCLDKGKWNSMWTCFLYEIPSLEGCYCFNCVLELAEFKDESVTVE